MKGESFATVLKENKGVEEEKPKFTEADLTDISFRYSVPKIEPKEGSPKGFYINP